MAQAPITSRSNPLVRRLRTLLAHATGELCAIEGPVLLREALAAGVDIVEAAASSSFGDESLLRDLETRGCAARSLDPQVLAAISSVETSQGILAIARRPEFEETRFFAAARPLVVVACAIQDPGNLGALFRTAEAAGVGGVYVSRDSADPLSWKALRGSMGSAFRLPHVVAGDIEEVVRRVRRRGLAVAATVARGGVAHDTPDLTRPLALLVGNEAAGLPRALVDSADMRLTIPMSPPVESLNVGVAAAVILFESARQRRAAEQRT